MKKKVVYVYLKGRSLICRFDDQSQFTKTAEQAHLKAKEMRKEFPNCRYSVHKATISIGKALKSPASPANGGEK